MASTFGSYSIASSGMRANQTALTVLSHNMSNINTSGYSRQQVTMKELYTQNGSNTGSGCTLSEIRRARNLFLDGAYRNQSASSGYWGVKAANFEDMQLLLNEYSAGKDSAKNGLQATFTKFFNSWEELHKAPNSQSNRKAVLEDANAWVVVMAGIDKQLKQLQNDCCKKVKDGVDCLNDLAGEVAKLNLAIVQTEAGGAEAGDLRDRRDILLDEMSKWADIDVYETSNGMTTVSIGGVALVKGYNTNTLEVQGDGSAQHPLTVKWTELGSNLEVSSGSLKAYLEDADQSGVTAIEAASLPYNFDPTASVSSIGNLRQGLNNMMTTLALEINKLHSSGYGLDGTTGLDFFLPVDASKPLSLENIKINPQLENVNLIAASSSGASGNGEIADKIGSLLDEKLFKHGALSQDGVGYYQTLISWVGATGEQADNMYDTKSNLVKQINSQRQSISAVSLDEEVSKMITYQKAYSASARILGLVDDLLGGLINEIG
jgi:flagellar hook-associated protein 1 FlgK